jgi:DNA-binding CsgD family transcriptional regulator
MWYPSVGVLTVVAVAAGPRAGLVAAGVVAAGYLVGVELHGGSVFSSGDSRPVTEFLGLPLWTATAGGLVEWLARFILRLNRSQRHTAPVQDDSETARPPRTDAGGKAKHSDALAVAAEHPAAHIPDLTARQLEVVLLLRDGLHYDEVAAVLGISVRQVQKHTAAARERLHARTTGEVVARVVAAGLVPERRWEP